MAAVIELEHSRLRPGQIAEALHAWMAAALRGTADTMTFTCPCPACSGEGPRSRLEFALRRLPAWASPYLMGLVRPIDARFLARTLPDLSASPDLPWWERRLPIDRPTAARPLPEVRR